MTMLKIVMMMLKMRTMLKMAILVMVNKGLWFKFITSVSLLLGGMNRIGELRCL